jgi:hypothetical protein
MMVSKKRVTDLGGRGDDSEISSLQRLDRSSLAAEGLDDPEAPEGDASMS